MEAKNQTWLKLNRSIINSNVFTNPEVLKVFIWILCKANYAPSVALIGLTSVKLEPGQMIFGRKAAAAELGMSESKCYRIVTTLEKLGTISIKSNNKFSVISVDNWGFFQASEQQTNNKRTANEQQTNNKRTHYKKDKNIKKEKNIKPAGAEEVPSDELAETLNNYFPQRDF